MSIFSCCNYATFSVPIAPGINFSACRKSSETEYLRSEMWSLTNPYTKSASLPQLRPPSGRCRTCIPLKRSTISKHRGLCSKARAETRMSCRIAGPKLMMGNRVLILWPFAMIKSMIGRQIGPEGNTYRLI
ncbi:hypothetical protein Nepgr_002195 [Nepenthes gracilis]|uniref:Uncharacterized protein n=1 Tax=Nepenthes gracilis TaxID=150966 RepID=A0AAD3P5U1_NEPGR|nr:hypothetical protein Nepgr_002195 [Nepenthes gracilis]